MGWEWGVYGVDWGFGDTCGKGDVQMDRENRMRCAEGMDGIWIPFGTGMIAGRRNEELI